MNETASDWFEEPKPAPDDEVLYVDVAGYEGPLDLLLDLAVGEGRPVAHSVLALAEQYLGFIETIREKRIRDRRRLPGDGGLAGYLKAG